MNLSTLRIRGHLAFQTVLENGATVVAIHAPHARNRTVALAVRAGMRDELPGQEGMMHLIEHMVYQDSSLSQGLERQLQVARAAGVLGAHTHMDYTEFYETAGLDDVSTMIRRLVEQAFYPAFKGEQLLEQIAAVATERRNRLAKAPGGLLPWPHLTSLYWRDHSNTHDGSGDMDLSDRATATVLRNLHAKRYRPDTAAVVALSDQPGEEVVAALAEAMSAVPGRRDEAEVPEQAGQAITQSSVMTAIGERPRLLSATAAAPKTPTPPMLGDLVVAELLAAQRGLDASAGLFGPGDMVHDDLFVVVDDTAFALDPADRLRAASVTDDDLLLHAVGRAAARAEASTADDGCLTRAVARDVLLRGEPTFAPDLVTRLRGLLTHPKGIRTLVAEASTRLTSQPFASIRIQVKEDAT